MTFDDKGDGVVGHDEVIKQISSHVQVSTGIDGHPYRTERLKCGSPTNHVIKYRTNLYVLLYFWHFCIMYMLSVARHSLTHLVLLQFERFFRRGNDDVIWGGGGARIQYKSTNTNIKKTNQQLLFIVSNNINIIIELCFFYFFSIWSAINKMEGWGFAKGHWTILRRHNHGHCSVFCGSVLFCGSVFCGSVFCGSVLCGSIFCASVFCSSVFCGSIFCGSVFCTSVLCGSVFWAMQTARSCTRYSVNRSRKLKDQKNDRKLNLFWSHLMRQKTEHTKHWFKQIFDQKQISRILYDAIYVYDEINIIQCLLTRYWL